MTKLKFQKFWVISNLLFAIWHLNFKLNLEFGICLSAAGRDFEI